MVFAFHNTVIKTPHATILVDTCSGNDKERPHKPRYHRKNWPYLANLAAAGFAPEDIDYVLCTIAHLGSDDRSATRGLSASSSELTASTVDRTHGVGTTSPSRAAGSYAREQCYTLTVAERGKMTRNRSQACSRSDAEVLEDSRGHGVVRLGHGIDDGKVVLARHLLVVDRAGMHPTIGEGRCRGNRATSRVKGRNGMDGRCRGLRRVPR